MDNLTFRILAVVFLFFCSKDTRTVASFKAQGDSGNFDRGILGITKNQSPISSSSLNQQASRNSEEKIFVTGDLVKSFDIKCILSDVDGTLLTSNHGFSDITYEAIRDVMNKGYPFFPCTGRTRASMIRAVGDKFVKLFGESIEHIPGVYQQGLTVYGKGGEMIYKKALNLDVVDRVVELCEKNGIPLLAYCGEEVYCRVRCVHTDKVVAYADPVPIEVPEGLPSLIQKGIDIQKLIMVYDDHVLDEKRPFMEQELQSLVTLTKAVPGLLEVLPFGASKGEGVQVLLDHFDMSTEHVIAFGDGENDIEMLTIVKYGVAMENANKLLKDRAQYYTGHVNDHGVANVLKHLPNRTS